MENSESNPVQKEPPKNGQKESKSSLFFDKYGSKKWLLPLLIFLGILIFGVSVFGVMDSQDTNSDQRQSRREKREARKERKEKRRKNGKKKKNKKKNNKKKNAKAVADAGWTNFSFSNNGNNITLQYPGGLKVNITNGTARTNTATQTNVVSFTGNTQNIKMTTEPNVNALALTAWHDQLEKINTIYSTPTEQITVNGQQSLLQHTLGATANWHAFVPLGKNQVLWIDMNYGGGKEEAQEVFLEMLDTLTVTAN